MDQETQCNASIAGYESIKILDCEVCSQDPLLASMIWEFHMELL